MKLGVNVDHTATLREARKTTYPEPVISALLAEEAGADSVVAHLREDRRHIKEEDIFLIKEMIKIPFNLEMSTNEEIVDIACKLKPHQATLVPERRQELTTEGGLDVIKHYKRIERVTRKLKKYNIRVSLFIDPFRRQIKKAKQIGVDNIEINTGRYSEAKTSFQAKKELYRIKEAAKLAKDEGLFVAAGHGLNYKNTRPIVKIKEIEELNIGHSIISYAVFVGIGAAVREMLSLIRR